MKQELTLSDIVPETCPIFCVATSETFFPASVIRSLSLEAPIVNADQLWNTKKRLKLKSCRHNSHLTLVMLPSDDS